MLDGKHLNLNNFFINDLLTVQNKINLFLNLTEYTSCNFQKQKWTAKDVKLYSTNAVAIHVYGLMLISLV